MPLMDLFPPEKAGGRGGVLVASVTAITTCHSAIDRVILDVTMLDEFDNKSV